MNIIIVTVIETIAVVLSVIFPMNLYPLLQPPAGPNSLLAEACQVVRVLDPKVK